MKEEKIMECAGDLMCELNEISNIIPENDKINQIFTNTVTCSTFFTIYCC